MSVLFNILSLPLSRLCSIDIVIQFLVQRALQSMWHYILRRSKAEAQRVRPHAQVSPRVRAFRTFCLNSQGSLSTSRRARMASKQVTTLKTAERMEAPCIASHLAPHQDLLLPQGETQPQEDEFYPRGSSNSQRLSASLISDKTQQTINYNFSRMVSHVPLQASLCPQRKEDFSAAKSGPR